MTRAESYAEGWHEGRRWAEKALRRARGEHWDEIVGLREYSTFYVLNPNYANGERRPDSIKARALGQSRGYRQTVADFESGHLTFAQFDSGPPR